jgi:hypothetical protein
MPAKTAKARFIPPRKRTDAATVEKRGDCLASRETRSLVADVDLRPKYIAPAPNQRMFSTSTTSTARESDVGLMFIAGRKGEQRIVVLKVNKVDLKAS